MIRTVTPYHSGIYHQRGSGIGGLFAHLFRTIIPITKSVIKSSPTIVKNIAKSKFGKKLKKSAQKIALKSMANLIESGNVKDTVKKSIRDSKSEIAATLRNVSNSRKRKSKHDNKYRTKSQKYHILK